MLYVHMLGTEEDKLIATNIHQEVMAVLQKTNGSNSCDNLSVHIAGLEDKTQPISEKTLTKYVMETKGINYFIT